MAISIISNQIRNGEIECGLAMGAESLSGKYVDTSNRARITPLIVASSQSGLEGTLSDEIMAHPIGRDCMSKCILPLIDPRS